MERRDWLRSHGTTPFSSHFFFFFVFFFFMHVCALFYVLMLKKGRNFTVKSELKTVED